VAEFVPALAVKGIKFDTEPNELQKAVGRKDSDSDDIVDDASSKNSLDVMKLPEGITTRRPLGASEEKEPGPSEKPETPPPGKTTEPKTEEVGVAMAKDELVKKRKDHFILSVTMSMADLHSNYTESGIIVFNVIAGQLAKKGRLEVCMDDGYWPAFSTVRARSTHAQWQHVGEGFLKELDFGRVWLRLNENEEGDKDNIIAEWKGDAKAFLESSLVCTLTFLTTRLTVDAGAGWSHQIYFGG